MMSRQLLILIGRVFSLNVPLCFITLLFILSGMVLNSIVGFIILCSIEQEMLQVF